MDVQPDPRTHPVGTAGAWRHALRRYAPLIATLLVRLPFLVGAAGATFIGDEPAYLRLGRSWAEHGAYTGQWPPLHPAYLALCFECFGDSGVLAARIGLTLLSVLVAALVMRLAREVSGERAGRLAGWLYALHLPLVPYAHAALSETLYLVLLLPATLCLARAGRLREATPSWVLPAAGALLGAASLVRESNALVLLAVLPWVALATRASRREGARAAALVAACAALVIAPWTARNLYAYGKVVPVAITSGTNIYLGFNELYTNFDLVRLPDPNPRQVLGSTLRARLLANAPPGWPRSAQGNHAARDAEHVRTGLGWALAHPGYVLRTRLLRLADFFTPLSYAVKYQRLATYSAPLDHRAVRVSVGWLAVVQVLALSVVAILGYAGARFRDAGRGLLLTLAAALTAPALVVAMSRFRAPLEVLALIVAAAYIAGPRETAPPRRLVLAVVALLALGFCWFLSLPPTVASLEALP